jgi:putative PIN family toxin of toxin-antitoxin system
MRVVFDANIYVSFILTGGEIISSLFNAWQSREFEVLISDEITAEVKEVCDRFLRRGTITEESVKETLWRLDHDSRRIKVVSLVTRSKDVKDNKYLSCAKDGEADYLVTGDKKHLLSFNQFGTTRIVSPKEFVEILQKGI